MRSKHFLGLCLVGSFAAMALVGTGCGGGTTSTSSSGGGGEASGGAGPTTTTSSTTTTGSHTTTSTTTSTTTGSNTSSSTGAGGATGNHDFASAISIDANSMANTTGALVDADTTSDYYKFTGTKGERITAVVNAQGLAMGMPLGDDNTVIDAVVTIYDSAKKQIAQNDDAWPRSGRDPQAFTVLPADGDYYVEVNDCNTAFPGGGCAPTTNIVTFNYELFVADVDKLNAPEVNEGAEPNDDTLKAVKATYTVPSGGKAGNYSFSTIDGTFQTATDVDVYQLSIPADTVFDANQRAHAEFWAQPITPNNGTGASANAKLWVVDSDDITKHVAEVDQANYSDGDNQTNGPIDMSVPVVAGHKYFLFVQHGAGASVPLQDFYFIKHFIGTFYYGQLEKSPDVNDTLLTAEKLTTPAMIAAGNYFVDGNLSTALDVDYYTMDVATGAVSATLFCDAQRSGSGLRNAKFSLLTTDGSALGAGNVLSELPNKDIFIGGMTPVMIPAGTAKVILKVEAASQDPLVTGNFYHCSVSVAAPVP